MLAAKYFTCFVRLLWGAVQFWLNQAPLSVYKWFDSTSADETAEPSQVCIPFAFH